jgi:hypothetical protein
MNQVNARHEIIQEWRSLPKELRQTDEQAAAFAMQIKDKYKFSSDSADRYQTVKDWLLHYLSITRGLERNAAVEAKMSSGEKSTDAGLSAAERKTLRTREAEEAIAEHESVQKAFRQNRERAGRTSRAGGRGGADALSGAGASRRHPRRERPICYQDTESTPCRWHEDDWGRA